MNPTHNITTENARGLIELVLRESKTPLTTHEAGRLAGLGSVHASRVVRGLLQSERIRVSTKRPEAYEWCGPPREEDLPKPEATWKAGSYTGERPLPMRPGAGDFLKAPSRVGDERIERKRPALISAREE